MMSDLKNNILNIGGGVFSLLLVMFTGWNTYHLVLQVTNNWLVSLVGLVVFEIAMVYWMAATLLTAEGLGQMAISATMSVVSVLFVSAGTLLHLGAVNVALLGDTTINILVGLAAVINLAAEGAYWFAKPSRLNTIRQKALMGRMDRAVAARVESLLADAQADEVELLAGEAVRRLVIENRNSHNQRLGVDDGMLNLALEPQVIYAETKPQHVKIVEPADEEPLVIDNTNATVEQIKESDENFTRPQA